MHADRISSHCSGTSSLQSVGNSSFSLLVTHHASSLRSTMAKLLFLNCFVAWRERVQLWSDPLGVQLACMYTASSALRERLRRMFRRIVILNGVQAYRGRQAAPDASLILCSGLRAG